MNKKLFPIMLAVMLIPYLADAYLTSGHTCSEMAANADVIIRGQLVDGVVKDIGPARHFSHTGKTGPLDARAAQIGAEVFRGRIRVDQVFKGGLKDAGADVSFYGPGGVDLKPKREMLLFLRKTDAGLFVYDLDSGELLTRAAGSSHNEPASLHDELFRDARDSDPQIARGSISCLSELDGASAEKDLTQLMSATNIAVESRVVALLVESGNHDAVQRMVDILTSPNFQKPASSGLNQAIVADFVRAIWSLQRRRDQSLAIPIANLLDHKDESVRQAAIFALRGMKNPATFPAMAKLLDDKNEKYQYAAVITFCEFAQPKRAGCPSMSKFKQNQEKYVADWKAWWVKQKKP